MHDTLTTTHLTSDLSSDPDPTLRTYVHLAARPQVNLFSLGRKRFAHLSEQQDEVHVDANIPWGEDTLFTLEFRDNHYALHTCNNLYLQREGGLQSSCAEDCLFSIEYHNGSLALRDRAGKYLSPVGSKVRRRLEVEEPLEAALKL